MQHIDVREEGKENAFSLGSSLFIGTEVGTKVLKGGRRIKTLVNTVDSSINMRNFL